MTKLADQQPYAGTQQLHFAYPNVFDRVAPTTLEQSIRIASNDIEMITRTTHDAYPDTDGNINRLCLIMAAIEICTALLADAEDEKLEDYTFSEVAKFKELLAQLKKERDLQLKRGGFDSEAEVGAADNQAIARGRGWKRRTDTSSTVQYAPTSVRQGKTRW